MIGAATLGILPGAVDRRAQQIHQALWRRWVFGAKPSMLAVSCYGRTAWVLLVAVLAAAAARAIPRVSDRALRIVAMVAGFLLVAATGVCLAANIDRPTGFSLLRPASRCHVRLNQPTRDVDSGAIPDARVNSFGNLAPKIGGNVVESAR